MQVLQVIQSKGGGDRAQAKIAAERELGIYAEVAIQEADSAPGLEVPDQQGDVPDDRVASHQNAAVSAADHLASPDAVDRRVTEGSHPLLPYPRSMRVRTVLDEDDPPHLADVGDADGVHRVAEQVGYDHGLRIRRQRQQDGVRPDRGLIGMRVDQYRASAEP